jgi:hypothetical protein
MLQFRDQLNRWTLVAITAVGVLVQPTAVQAQPLPAGLSPAKLQQLAGDLTRFPNQDFFRQGRIQAEREIERLDRRQAASEDLLDVQEQAPLPEELSPDEIKGSRQQRNGLENENR